MGEYEIATTKVLPYIRTELRWPETLISKYGRVPIQIGTTVAWADFVCYMAWRNRPRPYLLVEVKRQDVDLQQCISQAESYALILGTPFFVVTDGTKYHFFLRGASQGESIRLESKPPLPSGKSLPNNLDFIQFPPEIDPLVQLFFQALKNDAELLEDTKRHSRCLEYWNQNVFANLDKVSARTIRQGIEDNMMVQRPPNKYALLRVLNDDFSKVKKVLRFVSDFGGDSVQNLNRLLDRAGELHIRGAGLFVVTQLLAAAHPSEYVVLEDNIARALKDLGMTDVVVKADIANGYIYANELCRRLYRDKLKEGILEGNFGSAPGFELVSVHNFLWHYYAYFKKKGTWT